MHNGRQQCGVQLLYDHKMLNAAIAQNTVQQNCLPEIYSFQAIIRKIYLQQASQFLYATSLCQLGIQERPNIHQYLLAKQAKRTIHVFVNQTN